MTTKATDTATVKAAQLALDRAYEALEDVERALRVLGGRGGRSGPSPVLPGHARLENRPPSGENGPEGLSKRCALVYDAVVKAGGGGLSKAGIQSATGVTREGVRWEVARLAKLGLIRAEGHTSSRRFYAVKARA